jgi:hypothetical protein
MDKLLEKLQTSVKHLKTIDDFFLKNDKTYKLIRDAMTSLPDFDSFADSLYYGQDGRQMILGDLIEYIITGRLFYRGFENQETFSKIIFYLVNQLMLQENVILNQKLRKKILDNLEKSNLTGFFDGKDIKWRSKYQHCKIAPNKEVDGARKPLYRVIDSVLPKSLGTATELLVFVYLINGGFGYVIPLLTVQRLSGMSGEKELIPPDFLLIRKGKIFGFEVGAGPRGYGKIEQSNRFMEETSIPVVTFNVNPPGNNASYRCPERSRWILYCDRIINEYSTNKISEVNKTGIDCQSCPNFRSCQNIMYYGRTEPNGKVRHYHYRCVETKPYVVKAIQKNRVRLSPLYLTVQGLESFEK